MPIPPLQPAKQSDHVASMLYIADFLTQFTKVLAIKPITFQELSACLHPHTPANALLDPAATAGNRAAAVAVNGAVANGVLANGVRDSGDDSEGITAAGSEALFELYRGLLQFLLQVSFVCCGVDCLLRDHVDQDAGMSCQLCQDEPCTVCLTMPCLPDKELDARPEMIQVCRP